MKKFFPVLLLCCSSFCNLFSQTPEKAIENIKQHYTAEGIYIHFDKDIYVAGETIWFKAYLHAGMVPALYSTVVNVELLNDSGRIITKKILPVINAAAVGEFILTQDMPQMNYTVRAYTKQMLNFGTDNFYQHRLQVLNPKKAKMADSLAIIPRLYFMPEGGSIIGSIPSLVAFKASNQFGEPIDIEGELFDNNGQSLKLFRSVHNGMGSFTFLPQAGETYEVRYQYQNKQYSEKLPAVKSSGITFMVQTDNGKRLFLINQSKIANPSMSPAYLLGVMNNEVLFNIPLPPNAALLKGELPEKDLPSGILQLTAFTSTHQPLAERMIFINNNEFLVNGQFKTETVSLAARKKNVFSFTVSDTIAGSYSVAVLDAGRDIPGDNRENIISSILLQNDIRDMLYNPLYYFEAPFTADKQKHLDLVMMTSGWRRFNWDQVMNKRLPALSYKDMNYISFAGRAYQSGKNSVLPNTDLYAFLRTKDSSTDILEVRSDSLGNVRIDGMIFNDTATIAFKNISSKKAVVVGPVSQDLSQHFFVKDMLNLSVRPLPGSDRLTALANGIYSDNLLIRERIVTLETIRLQNDASKAAKTKLVNDRYATGMFGSNASHVYDLINNSSANTRQYLNVFEYLKVNAVGMTVSGNALNYSINIRNARSLMGGPIPATLFLDGFEVPATGLATLNFQEVAYIKVYSSSFGGAGGGGVGGAVAVFTKKGDDRGGLGDPALSAVKIEGFAPAKEFFSPNYDKDPATAVPDRRVTLYWDPYIITGAGNTTIKIPFYTSENESKGFRVLLTGMNADGKLLYLEKFIK